MPIDRFAKVYAVLRAEFPDSGNVTLCVGTGDADGDSLVCYQEQEDMLIGDDFRQTRTIGVRLVAVSPTDVRAKEIMNRAIVALEAAPNVRVFDRTGTGVDQDNEGPDPTRLYIASQRVDVR